MATGPAVSIALTRMQFPQAPVALFGPLTLEVPPGEVVALIGPSGVGKTSLLRMIGGLEPHFDGQVRVGGQPADLAPPPGFVFQDARLLPWLDAAANIRAVKPEISAAEIDGTAGQGRAQRAGSGLSTAIVGRHAARLGLARAIAAGSGLLLLDEPFVSLDRAVVKELQRVFREIFEAEDPTVIVVSHDPEDAARLADRVVVLAGRPAQDHCRFPPATRGYAGPAEIARAVQTILDAQKEET